MNKLFFMALHNIYKPRYFFRNRTQSKIYLYKDGYLRRFFERRGRRAKRGGLFRRYILVANNRKWTIARRFIRPLRRWRPFDGVKRSRSPVHGRPVKRRYKNAFYQKQRVRHFYGNDKEHIFRTLYRSYKSVQGSTSNSFFSLLESRLDRTLYRRRMFPTLYGSRQFINYHGVYVNNNIETSSRYRRKLGDVISLPVFAWRSLYWDLYCRVYYRRWGRYISSRRFYTQFQKKIFKTRRYFLRNTTKISKNSRNKQYRFYFAKNKKKLWKGKPIAKKLWFNYLTPFSVAQSFQFFKPKKTVFFRKNKKKTKKTVRQYFLQIQRNRSRRGFFLLRSRPKMSPNALNSKQKKIRFIHKLHAFTRRKRKNMRNQIKKKLIKFAIEQGFSTNFQHPKNPIMNELAIKNNNWIVGKNTKQKANQFLSKSKNYFKKVYGISPYIKKKYNILKTKKKKTKKYIKNHTFFYKKSFYKHYIQKQQFSSRIFLKKEGNRLFRRSFSKKFSLLDTYKEWFDFKNLAIKRFKKNESDDPLIGVRLFELFKKFPQRSRQLKSSYVQSFRNQVRAEYADLELKPAPHPINYNTPEFVEKWDLQRKPHRIYVRKRSILRKYFFNRKLRKKKFAALRSKASDETDSSKTYMNDESTKKDTQIVPKENDTLFSQKNPVHALNAFSFKYDSFFSSRVRKSNFFTIFSLKALKKKLLVKLKKKNGTKNKKIKKKKFNNFFQQKRKLKVRKNIFKEKRKKKKKYVRNRYRKKGFMRYRKAKVNSKKGSKYNQSAINSYKKFVQKPNEKEKNTLINTQNSSFNNTLLKKFRVRKARKKKGIRRNRLTRVFRRVVKRFFRRRKRFYKRRRRSFPRLKSIHRYFPSYVQYDLRTLRSRKINNITTKEIQTGFRLSPAKIFAFYKSRGF